MQRTSAFASCKHGTIAITAEQGSYRMNAIDSRRYGCFRNLLLCFNRSVDASPLTESDFFASTLTLLYNTHELTTLKESQTAKAFGEVDDA